MKIIYLTIVFILIAGSTVSGQQAIQILDVAKLISRQQLTTTGYCSDGSDRARNGVPRFHGPMEAKIISFNNYQYCSYFESDGSIIVARKKMADNSKWKKLAIEGYRVKSQDRHNKIALIVSKGDGVIHISFDHHNTPQLNYAKSKINVATNPELVVWDNHVFSLVPNLGLSNNTGLVTYPSFYPINASGNILMYWRTGGANKGEMNLANYNSKNHQWRFIGKISSMNGTYKGKKGTRGPYHAGFVSDTLGNLHVSWLWREDFNLRNGVKGSGNHGLNYAKSNNGGFSWENTFGVEVANTRKNTMMSSDNLDKVPISILMTLDPSNVGLTSCIDPETNNYMVMVTHNNIENTKRTNFLYIKTPKGVWSSKETTINEAGIMRFYKNNLLVFTTSGIYFATKSSEFSDWKKITFPLKIKNGNANWDLNQFKNGIVSMAIQYKPESIGKPSSIEVFDFKIFE